MKSEDRIQQDCVIWFKNNYCLAHHTPKYCIFHVPNEGKDMREQLKKRSIGMLAGVSDLVVLLPGKVLFIEMKDEKGKQSVKQESFQRTVVTLGFDYYIIRSLSDFKQLIYEHIDD